MEPGHSFFFDSDDTETFPNFFFSSFRNNLVQRLVGHLFFSSSIQKVFPKIGLSRLNQGKRKEFWST